MPETIPYDKAKAGFEAIVKKMQSDLEAYAKSGKANQRAVDVRLEIINRLIEYYEAAESAISGAEMETTGLSIQYGKLHADTQKLVHWCSLHGVNPNQIFQFSRDELEEMLRFKRRFRSAEDLAETENTIINRQNEKYITTSLTCLRNQTIS